MTMHTHVSRLNLLHGRHRHGIEDSPLIAHLAKFRTATLRCPMHSILILKAVLSATKAYAVPTLADDVVAPIELLKHVAALAQLVVDTFHHLFCYELAFVSLRLATTKVHAFGLACVARLTATGISSAAAGPADW